jgi:NAD(P)-dependent dehydrogenase (short-subunit alcohol dehydrogenase family)
MNRLNGKVAIVTGAARGIGRGIAELFAAEGAIVVATDVLDPEPYLEPVEFAPLDVTNELFWPEVVAEVERRHGHLDVLVNNAGLIAYSPLDTLQPDEWARIIAVDQTGVWLGMRAAVPAMRRAGGGSIINLSSAWGVIGGVGAHAYAAAKGAVRSMTRNAAITYAADNIRANSVVPGWIHTPLTNEQPAQLNDAVLAATPLGRGAHPVDIAYGCVYLASEEAAFVTGSDLVIDGGLLAH